MRRAAKPWYRAGLRFSCHQCNNCCRGAQPGYVYVTARQIERIARFLERSLASIRKEYLTADENGESVLVLKENGDCIFWGDGCRIYPARPRQCRTFPFWKETLESRESWEELKAFCHGVDAGKLYSFDEIRSVKHGRATG